MAYLTRDQILTCDDLQYEECQVPEWGGAVLVRSLTGAERDKFEEETIKFKGKDRELNLKNLRARLVATCVVDGPGGKQVFRQADVLSLGGKNARALDRVCEVARRLSGITEEEIEELAENLEDDLSDDSGSDSPG